MDALSAALTFLKVQVIAVERHHLHLKVPHMVSGWKTMLCKEKRKLRKLRLERLSAEDLSLSEVSAMLECKLLWTYFNETCIDVERRETVVALRLDQATVGLAGSVLFKN